MFGGYCPFPIPLTDGAKTGLSAPQHSRLAADLVAMRRTAPFAKINCDAPSVAATPTLYSYRSQAGVGTAYAPTLTKFASGVVDLTWASSYEDDFGALRPINIYAVKITGFGVSPRICTYEIIAPNVVRIRVFGHAGTLVGGQFSATIYADWLPKSRIGDYGGDLNKQNTTTERTPYAHIWYRELTAMLPDAFTTATSGQVHAKKITLARSRAGIQRAIDRCRFNANPAYSDETLASWARQMNVIVRPDEERWKVRRRIAALEYTWAGNEAGRIDDAIQTILGDKLYQIVRYTGNAMSSPPVPTYWDGINPGPSSYDLGGGTWASRTNHLTVLVQPSLEFESQETQDLLDDLRWFLSIALPAKSTFTVGAPGPFLIGISRIGIDTL